MESIFSVSISAFGQRSEQAVRCFYFFRDSRRETPADEKMINKTTMPGLILQLVAGLQVKAKFVANRPDHCEDRRFLGCWRSTKIDIFTRTRPNPPTSSFLEQSSDRLQGAPSCWYSNEHVLFTNFYKARVWV